MAIDPLKDPDRASDAEQAEWTVVDEVETVSGSQAGSTSGPANSAGSAWEELHRRAEAQRAIRERQRPTMRFMFSHPAHIFSLGFGSGLARIMPGTAGTLAGWLIFCLLNPYMTTRAWLVLIVVGFVAGIWASGFTAKRMNQPDPGAIVWDEIIAIWIVLLYAMPTGFWGQFWAFIVFRFFDMVKPPPIRYFDRQLKGGFGIMFDDIVAALFTVAVIALFR